MGVLPASHTFLFLKEQTFFLKLNETLLFSNWPTTHYSPALAFWVAGIPGVCRYFQL